MQDRVRGRWKRSAGSKTAEGGHKNKGMMREMCNVEIFSTEAIFLDGFRWKRW